MLPAPTHTRTHAPLHVVVANPGPPALLFFLAAAPVRPPGRQPAAKAWHACWQQRDTLVALHDCKPMSTWCRKTAPTMLHCALLCCVCAIAGAASAPSPWRGAADVRDAGVGAAGQALAACVGPLLCVPVDSREGTYLLPFDVFTGRRANLCD